MPEYKTLPAFTKDIDGADSRTVIGIAAVHGNVDDGGDRSHPGSFADTKVAGRDRARFLWQHSTIDPPIAVINYVREVGRDALPGKVLDYAPDATGGVEVSRTYLDTPRGNEVLTGIKAGAIQEMSYAYDLTSYAFTEVDDRTIREIYGVKLFDLSDVIWGMNPATTAVKSLDWKAQPLTAHADAVEADVLAFVARIEELKERRAKEGRILSADNRKRVEAALEALTGASVALKDLLTASEPQKAQPDKSELRRLLALTQRNIAILNGVTL